MVNLACRVFVGNLAYKTSCEDLKEHFKQVGKVKKAEIYYDHSGRGPPTVVGRPVSKGCGVVEFEEPDDAKEAIKELSETTLDGRAILVREDRDPPPAHRRDDAPHETGGRPGDWICPKCADLQFASRRECRTCAEPKPETNAKTRPHFVSTGDWTCPNCGDHQFARNVKCRQCSEPKPRATRRGAASRSRSRSRSRRRSASRSRKGHRRRVRKRVKVKRDKKDKKRGRSKHKDKKSKKVKKDAKRKDAKKSKKGKEKRGRSPEKRKGKKHKEETSESESYEYSSYDSSYYSSD